MDAALLQRIDFFRLAINLGGNQRLIEEMLMLYLSTSASQMEKLEEAERNLNILAWKQITHQLKGAAKNITAKRFASLCVEAEEVHSFPHPQSGAVIYHMYKELALLRAAIDAHLKLQG